VPDGPSRRRLITFVADRPGHDHRYAIDATKLEAEHRLARAGDLETGLDKTVRWYLDNRAWWSRCARASTPASGWAWWRPRREPAELARGLD
jgi:dTDP-D-glucose 4,6-dehydratase